MSDDAEWNPEWWKSAKAASLERKVLKRAASAESQPGDSFLIVTEGTVTEPVYLNLVVADLQLATAQIVIEPGAASHPRHVIETAARLAQEREKTGRKLEKIGFSQLPKFDHIWAVIDTDVAVREGIWQDVAQLAASRKVKLAHSTPCFEFWLLLHFGLTTRGDLPDGTSAKAALREISSLDSTNEETTKLAMPSFIPLWPDAVANARRVRQFHLHAATPAPANPSTDVDVLVTHLNDAAPAHLRKL